MNEMKHIKTISAIEMPANAVNLPIWGSFDPLNSIKALIGIFTTGFRSNTPPLNKADDQNPTV